jgi:hypothetical protein
MDLSKENYAVEITETLMDNGFRSVKNGKEVVYFQDNSGIYRPYDVGDIKRWLLGRVGETQDRNKLLKMPLGTIDTIAAGLPTHDSRNPLKTFSDRRDKIFIPFLNGVVVIGQERSDLLEYSQVTEMGYGGIWEESIIQREIDLDTLQYGFSDKPLVHQLGGKYSQFIQKAMIKDGDDKSENYLIALKALESVIGYLCHQYNDPGTSKYIFLTDASLDGKPEGGNGKTLVIQSLEYVRNFVQVDGKNWQAGGSAARFNLPDTITEKTDIVCLDDVQEGFDASQIFSATTGDFTIEPKGINKRTIPKDQKPKIVITSNYFPFGTGNSYDRRRHIIEFGNYWFHKERAGVSIEDELDGLLFDDFSVQDWKDFYYFIFGCCQKSLRSGKLRPMNLNALKRNTKLASIRVPLSMEHLEWVENHLKNERTGVYDTKPGISEDTLYKEFVDDFGDTTEVDKKTLHTALYDFVDVTPGLEYNQHKPGKTKSQKRFLSGPKGKQKYHIVVGGAF